MGSIQELQTEIYRLSSYNNKSQNMNFSNYKKMNSKNLKRKLYNIEREMQ